MNTESRTLRTMLRMPALTVALAIAGGVQAADASVEQRVSAELSAIMAELIETGAFGSQPSERIALAVDTPARRVSDLGLLVDSSRHSDDGLHVLAVTPNGNAERIGLRAGDIVVALNGTSLTGADSAGRLRQQVEALPDGGALAFRVNRAGSSHTLNGNLSSVYLPAMHLTIGGGAPRVAATASVTSADVATSMAAGCGRISDFDVAPRQQQLHAARIISIDGATPGPGGSHSFRVEPGTHSVKVAEDIESRYLSFSDRARNAGLSSDRYKTLLVEVAPDTTTFIAARINDEHRTDPRNGAYWDPIAWKQTAEVCR
jgi:membrane-associated protease RseP (regulator of RpoE activity)